MSTPPESQAVAPLLSTQRWVWRALVRSALIPLLLVEVLLVVIYLFSSSYIHDANIDLLRRQADEQLVNTVRLEVSVIDEQLHAVSALTDVYRQAVERAFGAVRPDHLQGKQDYERNADGVLYSPVNDGRAASFYSAVTPVDQQDMKKVHRLEPLDSLMQGLMQASPLINAIYFNSWDSYNRIYPWFHTPSQYPSDLAIPEYTFYYAADAVHNPARDVVWTDVYVDPAGLGWMTSAVAPVYRGNFLEGVVGLDVTVKTIVQQILQLDIPWQGYVMLINRQGTIMALPPKGENDFGMQELTQFSYLEAVTQESFKPEQFNIQQRADTRVLAEMMRNAREGRGTLQLGGREKRVAWREIGATGWQLLAVVDEAEVYRSVDDLAHDFRTLGYWLITGLLLFYLLFFVYIWRRSVWLSRAISAPLDTLNRIMVDIGQEHYAQPRQQFELQELQQSADAVVAMGAELGRANRAKTRFLSSVSHELRTPLSSIIGFAELLRGSNRLGADEQGCVDEILHAAHLLLSLINDVLDLAQVQADHVSVRAESVLLGELVGACLRMVEPQAIQKGIQLFRVENCEESVVWADPKRLQQVLLNLLSNAIKYNRPDGRVRIVCRDLGDHIRISVSDSGVGLSAEALQGLFVPFNRLGHEASNIPGTGIGLTISKQLVELMGGRIGCDSVPEHGSTFWVELPTAGEENAAAQD